MEYQFKKVRLGELEAFAQSWEFKQSDVIPISSNRIKSYVNNPRADKNDVVLYMLFEGRRLIGFRTLLVDCLTWNDKTHKLAWLSGVWVRPEYRRKGIATSLYLEAKKDWAGRLMYTNYAPEAHKLLDKVQDFNLFDSVKGTRYYFRFFTAELLKLRHPWFAKNQAVLKGFDASMNLVSFPVRFFQKIFFSHGLNKVIIEKYGSKEIFDFIDRFPQSVFKRGSKEYSWIFTYPWISPVKCDPIYYPFSSFSTVFFYRFFVVNDGQGNIDGLAIVKFRDGHVTVPYFYGNSKSNTKLARAVVGFSHGSQAKSLTIYQPADAPCFRKLRGMALVRKKRVQNYFINSKFQDEFPLKQTNIALLDGDGDCIFT